VIVTTRDRFTNPVLVCSEFGATLPRGGLAAPHTSTRVALVFVGKRAALDLLSKSRTRISSHPLSTIILISIYCPIGA
jgi:hypothetical protein